MWLWVVLWRASACVLVAGTIDISYFAQKRPYVPTMQMNCYEYPKFNTNRLSSVINHGFQASAMKRMSSSANYRDRHPMRKRDIHVGQPRSFEHVLSWKGDIYKEHAKLVQDINSLKQVVFVAPLVDDNRDYDESIFHEIIETSTTTSPKPIPAKLTKPVKSSSIPIILLGGSSSRHVLKSQPISFPKSTINLVGTTSSPALKHPYPFVMQHDIPNRPIRVCMPTMAIATTTKPPSLLQRLINSLIPR